MPIYKFILSEKFLNCPLNKHTRFESSNEGQAKDSDITLNAYNHRYLSQDNKIMRLRVPG